MASLICFSSCFISSPASFADGNFRFHLKSPNRSPKFNSERFRFRVKALKEKTGEIERPSPDEVTKKYGLEAGLWKVPFSCHCCFVFLSIFLLSSLLQLRRDSYSLLYGGIGFKYIGLIPSIFSMKAAKISFHLWNHNICCSTVHFFFQNSQCSVMASNCITIWISV